MNRSSRRTWASIALFLTTAAGAACRTQHTDAPPEPAAALAPQDVLDVIRYDISVVPRAKSHTARVSVAIEAVLRVDAVALPLHYSGPPLLTWSVGDARENVEQHAEESSASRDGDVLRLLLEHPLRAGDACRLQFEYDGAPGKGLAFTTASDPAGRAWPVMITDHWPEFARTWIPCVDHPSDRAAISVRVAPFDDVDSATRASENCVSNGLFMGVTKDGASVFEQREEIPICLLSIAVGPYDRTQFAADAEVGDYRHRNPLGPWIGHWFYAWDAQTGATAFAEVPRMLAYFDGLIGKYPYPRLSYVQAPTRYGGMENAGCIYIKDASITPKADLRGTLAHELAHQWFGDACGVADWRHLWLSEGFATYFGTRYMQESREDGDLPAAMASMQASVLQNPLLHQKPLVDDAPADVATMLNPLVYQKGACVLHALRRWLGDADFDRAVRTYVAARSGRANVTKDFAAAADFAAGKDASRFLDAWTRSNGCPRFHVDVRAQPEGAVISITQSQEQGASIFPCILDVELAGPAGPQRVALRYDTRRTAVIRCAPGPTPEVRLDPDHWLLFETEPR